MAIAAYEKPMRARAAEATQTSLETVEWMHADHAETTLLKLFNQQ